MRALGSGRERAVPPLAIVVLILGFALAGPASGETNPVVRLSTSFGDITIELYPDRAPITVRNFLDYVRAGYYDGTIFHRVVPNFIVQGGGLTRDMREKRDGQRPPIANESRNGLHNEAGTVGMARTAGPDSATSQFFINPKDNPLLDPGKARDGVGYAVFGRVVDGMDVVRRIERVQTAVIGPYANAPLEPIVIGSARVMTP